MGFMKKITGFVRVYHVWVPESWREVLDHEAELEGRATTAMIRHIVQEWLVTRGVEVERVRGRARAMDRSGYKGRKK